MQDLKTIALSMLLAFLATALQAGNYSYQPGAGVVFQWDDADRSCIYTADNDRIVMWVQSIDAGKHNISMTGYGWALASDNQYYLYYPYNPDYVINGNHHTSLPISYTGQTQHGNNSAAHLSPYDFMTAQATSTATDCHFCMKHLGAMIRIACLMPDAASIRDITLTSPQGSIFTESATMDVANSTVTPVQASDSLMLLMEGTTVAAGDSLIAYMMAEPSLISGKTILVNIDAMENSYIARFLLPEVNPGICYQLNGTAIARTALGLQTKGVAVVGSHAKGISPSFGEKATETITAPTATATDFALNTLGRYIAPPTGDANSDGTMSMADANITIDYALSYITHGLISKPEGIDLDNADMDMDGNITTADATAITRRFLNQ